MNWILLKVLVLLLQLIDNMIINGSKSLFFMLLIIAANVRRYVHVAAASRWRVFLHSWCDAGL